MFKVMLRVVCDDEKEWRKKKQSNAMMTTGATCQKQLQLDFALFQIPFASIDQGLLDNIKMVAIRTMTRMYDVQCREKLLLTTGGPFKGESPRNSEVAPNTQRQHQVL